MAVIPLSVTLASRAAAQTSSARGSLPIAIIVIIACFIVPVVILLGLLSSYYLLRSWKSRELWRPWRSWIPWKQRMSSVEKVDYVELPGHWPYEPEELPAYSDVVDHLPIVTITEPPWVQHSVPAGRGQNASTTSQSGSTGREEGSGRVKERKQSKSKQVVMSEKRAYMQMVTDPLASQPSNLHVAPAHVATTGGPSSACINPWEVEYRPNPVMFSHLYTPPKNPVVLSPVSLSSNGSPKSQVSASLFSIPSPVAVGPSNTIASSPAHVLPTGPYEMDATESAYNPWVHSPMLMVGEVPHRWEQTRGMNRMFFDADRDKFRVGVKRKCTGEDTSCDPRRQRLESAFSPIQQKNLSRTKENTFAPILRSGVTQPLEYDTSSVTKGKKPSSREMGSGSGASDLPQSSSTFSDKEVESARGELVEAPTANGVRRFQTYKGFGKRPEPSSWDLNEAQLSFLTGVAASHAQQVKFMAKFWNTGSSPASTFSTSRLDVIFDGDSSSSSTPTELSLSARSSQSSLVPVGSPSPGASSSSLATQASQSSSKLSTASSATTVSVESLKHNCSDCGAKFRTPGQMRQHFNRKHNHRFKCSHCDAAFGLRADLDRHIVNKHTDDLEHKPTKVFRCPNIGCTIPGKEFFRKDNFSRHAKRCGKVKGKGKARQKDESPP